MKNQNKMMKVRMEIIGPYRLPELFVFIKENHILEISKTAVGLYKKCLRLGYDIRDVELEEKHYECRMNKKTMRMEYIPMDEPTLKYKIDEYFNRKRLDKLYKKHDYLFRKENSNGSI